MRQPVLHAIFLAQSDHLHINTNVSSQKSQLLSVFEQDSPERSSELFVKPGKAIHRHAMPSCISTHKPGYC